MKKQMNHRDRSIENTCIAIFDRDNISDVLFVRKDQEIDSIMHEIDEYVTRDNG